MRGDTIFGIGLFILCVGLSIFLFDIVISILWSKFGFFGFETVCFVTNICGIAIISCGFISLMMMSLAEYVECKELFFLICVVLWIVALILTWYLWLEVIWNGI